MRPPAAPPETPEEITGPIPVIRDAGTDEITNVSTDQALLGQAEVTDQPGLTEQEDLDPEDVDQDVDDVDEEGAEDAVIPLAPLDQRFLQGVGTFLGSRPRWSERPVSMSEAWEYSTTGDWTASEKSVQRVLHGLCLLVAFGLTYPIAWAIQVSREKPIGFVLIIAFLFVLSKAL